MSYVYELLPASSSQVELTKEQQIIRALKFQKAILRKINEEELREALRDLLEGFGPTETAGLLGIHRATIYRWADRYNIPFRKVMPIVEAEPAVKAWLAGVIDCDCAILLTRHHSGGYLYLRPAVGVYNTDIGVIETVAELLDATPYAHYQTKHKRMIWEIRKTGRRALETMQQVEPYMKHVGKLERIKWMKETFVDVEFNLGKAGTAEAEAKFREYKKKLPPAVKIR